MFTVYKKSIEWGGRQLTLETGKMARQADGAVLATYGDTIVLATTVFQKQPKPGFDFFPLTCIYQEKFYAGGSIPGGFLKREGRPTEKETLVSRLIDRPIRPLFPKGFKNDTQVVVTVLQQDGENDADIVGMIAASASLALSGIPFTAPIAAARIGLVDGTLILNPTNAERLLSDLDLVVAGTEEGVMMVESEAKELPEDVMLEAVNMGHTRSQKVIKAIEELVAAAGKPKFEMPIAADTSAMEADLAKQFGEDIVAAFKILGKQERSKKLESILEAAKTAHAGPADARDAGQAELVGKLIKGMEADVLRLDVLKKKTRIDGRKTDQIRPIVTEVDTLPRTHGSALFTRGETQALVVATLGTGKDEQLIDMPEGESYQHFMLHYNFPPFSVGETGHMGAPGRREVGHGKLAWRAINPVLPTKEAFPYTLRIVSEVLESNGSSSMATVCGTSMALMAAGCPLARPVAGIAMGLVKEGKDYVVLSDIMGDEDHLGDMDFKVAGTTDGITALQMDIKITSITKDIMAEALKQALDGRLHILGKMNTAISEARTQISDYAPAMETIQIDKDNIRVLIGKGGETIRGLCEQYECTIDIDDDGKVVVASTKRDQLNAAIAHIQNMFAMPEIGTLYEGEVVTTVDFGAFVSFMGGKEGLVHISEVVPVRLGHITEVMSVGDKVVVKVVDLDDRGKIRLSVKGIEQPEGSVADKIAHIIANGPAPRPEGEEERAPREPRGEGRGDRGGRGGDRGGRGGGDRGPRGPREGGDRGPRPEGDRAPREPREGGAASRPRRTES